MTVSDGKVHKMTVTRALALPKGSIVVFDRGYTDYTWYHQLHTRAIFFVTRQREKARYRMVERRKVDKSKGLTGAKAQNCPLALCRIGFKDFDTGIQYCFLTNHFHLAASTIAAICKSRWQFELLFKWIKQSKAKRFLGTSENPVMAQLWIALCAYLLLAYLKFVSKINCSLQQTIRLLQLNLLERCDLQASLRGDPPEPEALPLQPSL